MRNTGRSLACLGVALALFAGCTRRDEPAAKRAGATTENCAAHGVSKELCFICDPSLRDPGRLWCNEHARYEDRCWECHPELQDKTRLYCNEHSLYEDECFLCHPELLKDAAAPKGTTPGASMICPEHGIPENEDGICHPELLAQMRPGEGLKIRLPSNDSASKAGVAVRAPVSGGMQPSVECLAELTFNQNRLARINPLAGGVVKTVEVDLGSRVKKGALLARVTSAAIGEAQGVYLRALAEDRLRGETVQRERTLRAERISSERDLQQAEAEHQAAMAAVQQARDQLLVLGFDEPRIRALTAGDRAAGTLDIRAPFAGEIIERSAVQGALVEVGTPLFTLADTTMLWAMVNIPEVQLALVRPGQKVELTVESLPGQVFPGTLTWVSASVDERTRMASGRVEVANAHGLLKAQMFAHARILTRGAGGGVLVPEAALQNIEGTVVVFVKSAEDLYEARPVQLGARHNGQVQVIAGLLPQDLVVVSGSFALKSQFLISRLGAGCVD